MSLLICPRPYFERWHSHIKATKVIRRIKVGSVRVIISGVQIKHLGTIRKGVDWMKLA